MNTAASVNSQRQDVAINLNSMQGILSLGIILMLILGHFREAFFLCCKYFGGNEFFLYLHCLENQTHYHIGWAKRLALKQREKATRKWLIESYNQGVVVWGRGLKHFMAFQFVCMMQMVHVPKIQISFYIKLFI